MGLKLRFSFRALTSLLNLTNIGLQIDFPISGRPNVRGTSGYAFRWWACLLGQIRDEGVGWSFERSAETKVSRRGQILLKLFQRHRAPRTLALEDAPLALVQ